MRIGNECAMTTLIGHPRGSFLEASEEVLGFACLTAVDHMLLLPLGVSEPLCVVTTGRRVTVRGIYCPLDIVTSRRQP